MIMFVIIVGVMNGDKILMIKFLFGYNYFLLILGYIEIGEIFEDIVCWEVFEEVGFEVYNIWYFGS